MPSTFISRALIAGEQFYSLGCCCVLSQSPVWSIIYASTYSLFISVNFVSSGRHIEYNVAVWIEEVGSDCCVFVTIPGPGASVIFIFVPTFCKLL